jgi:hypothetical protein
MLLQLAVSFFTTVRRIMIVSALILTAAHNFLAIETQLERRCPLNGGHQSTRCSIESYKKNLRWLWCGNEYLFWIQQNNELRECVSVTYFSKATGAEAM